METKFRVPVLDGKIDRAFAQGFRQGLAEALMEVLERRFVVTDEVRTKVARCNSRKRLENWIARARRAATLDEVFSTKPLAASDTAQVRMVRLVATGSRQQAVPTNASDTVVCMPQVDRFSITMPPELGEGVRQAAARQGVSVSNWIADAVARKLRNELLGRALDAWEAEDGPFTKDELDSAATALGFGRPKDIT